MSACAGACAMVCQALNIVSRRVCGQPLQPGSCMSDHSDGCRAGLLAEWPATPHGQCWPHLRRKLAEGAFCSKKHPHFDDLPRHLEAVHFSQSAEMRDFFTQEIGRVWDSWGNKWNMRSLWNEYMVAPWDNWSIGLFDCMLCTPSQQAHESWHKQIMQSRIPGMFKGSTEHVMEVALPKLISLDAAMIPDKLLFHVPATPRAMLEKAKWYAARQWERMRVEVDEDADGDAQAYFFFILSKGCTTWKKIDPLLTTRYNSLLMGEKPRGLTTLDAFIDVQRALHLVQYAEDAGRAAPACPENPLALVCNCKGFRHVGICSHVIVLNHWLGEIDLFHMMGDIAGGKRARGGYMKGVRPALIKERQEKEKHSRLK